MPTYTIRLNAAQGRRVSDALAHLNDGQPATDAQVQDWLLRQLRGQARQHSQRVESSSADNKVDTDLVAEGW